MKKLIITLLIMLFFVTKTIATNNNYKSHYVSIAHLHQIFEKVKRNSDVSERALSQTFNFYEKNYNKKHLSPYYLAIADYTKKALKKRLYIINLHSGKVYQYLVAHGKNSGKKGGRVWYSSNKRGSFMTPYGFFKIGDKEGITVAKKYDYLAVEGLEGKNKNVKAREILLHTAGYVAKAGKSLGCFAIRPQDKRPIFSKLKRALLYSYTGR